MFVCRSFVQAAASAIDLRKPDVKHFFWGTYRYMAYIAAIPCMQVGRWGGRVVPGVVYGVVGCWCWVTFQGWWYFL